MIRNVGVVLKTGAPEALELWQSVHAQFPNIRFLVEESGHHALERVPKGMTSVDADSFERESDLVLVLGGDGTFIHAAGLLQNRVVPILGVNLGRVGFLTEVPRTDLLDAFAKAGDGALPYRDRMRLEATIWRENELLLTSRVLNDAVLAPQAIARIRTYRVSLGAELVTTMRGDGVIVCTPTGSTGYSLAAGGSILEPGLDAVGITPICPHSLTQRPLAVTPDLDIVLGLDSPGSVYATLDGQVGRSFEEGDRLVVRRSPVATRILSIPGRSYFNRLRTKLGWGAGT